MPIHAAVRSAAPRPEEGLTIRFCLPQGRERHDVSASNRTQEPYDPAKGTPLTVLVADDEALVRDMLAVALGAFGFQIKIAADGAAALELYRTSDIDVVLLDVQMPVMDGAETLQALRQFNPAVACIFMSGGTGKYDTETLLELGAVDLVPKPFDLGELRELIVRAATR
jgi:CheY-like chemotaxis protein